jgi:hypothetical protein
MLIINPDSLSLFYRGTDFTRPRYDFYLGHPNGISIIVVFVLMEIIFLNYSKLKLWMLLPLYAVYLLFYIFTDTNTGLTVLSVIMICIVWEKLSPHSGGKFLGFMARYGMVIFLAFTMILVIAFPYINGVPKNIWLALDKALTGRLKYGGYTFGEYSFTLLGRKIVFPSVVYWYGVWIKLGGLVYFDNFYMNYLLLYGAVNPLLAESVFFVYVPKMETREKLAITAFVIYAMMEAYSGIVVFCFPLLLIGKYIYQSDGLSFCEIPQNNSA